MSTDYYPPDVNLSPAQQKALRFARHKEDVARAKIAKRKVRREKLKVLQARFSC